MLIDKDTLMYEALARIVKSTVNTKVSFKIMSQTLDKILDVINLRIK